jgi:hypothetical protein
VAAPAPSQPGEGTLLYGVVYDTEGGISRVARKVKNITSGSNNEKPGFISQETMQRVADAVTRANEYIRAQVLSHASHVRINFTSLSLKYKENGEERTVDINKIRDNALRSLILNIAKDLETTATTDPSIGANRPINRAPGLEINKESWYKAHHVTARDYLSDHEDLDRALRATPDTQALANTALPKIKAAYHLIHHFRLQLSNKLRDKEAELAALAPDQRAEKLAKINQIRELRKLLEKLSQERLDTKAIFRSVPYGNDDLRGFADLREQLTRADLSRDEMQAHLVRKDFADGIAFKDRPSPAFLRSYSNDKGDLLVHDRWIYENRVNDRGGELRGPSTEEAMVYAILNLNAPNEADCVQQTLSSLALRQNDAEMQELRGLVADALTQARTDTRAQYNADLARVQGHGSFEQQKEALFS